MNRKLDEKLEVYFIMGSINCKRNPEMVLREAIAGGIRAFQFREKGKGALSGMEKRQFALQLKRICHQFGVLFLVNDDVDLALEIDADGVHIGQEDLPVDIARKKIGNKILGVSVHNIEEAKIAAEHGADYLGVGPIYPTTTKLDIREVQGPSIIKKMRESGISLPIVGIGGITLGRVKPVISAGADGIAVISAIAQADSPRQMAQQLLKEVMMAKEVWN
jgi:thiamine-phosphate pyrophosphorylase